MMDMYEKAKILAEKAHAGQKRKNGESYINHGYRVSAAARSYVESHDFVSSVSSEEAAVVALLHDIVEDTIVTREDLRDQGFPESIIGAVDLLTHRKEDSYTEYIKRLRHSGTVCTYIVKLCDLDDNLNGATGTLKDKYELSRYILTR